MSSSAKVIWLASPVAAPPAAATRPVTTALPTTQNSRPSSARNRHSKVSAWPSPSAAR